jgi:hypothetical protein
MDTSAAAAYLGLSIQTLAIKRCDGTGPKFVKSGRVFYYREDLDEWLRAARAGSTAESRKVLSFASREQTKTRADKYAKCD